MDWIEPELNDLSILVDRGNTRNMITIDMKRLNVSSGNIGVSGQRTYMLNISITLEIISSTIIMPPDRHMDEGKQRALDKEVDDIEESERRELDSIIVLMDIRMYKAIIKARVN